MKRRKIILFTSLSIVLLFAFGFVASKSDIYYEISKNLELFGKVYKEISFNYVDEVDPKEFMRAGIKGMLNKLDPYTIFIDEKNQDDIDILTNGKYGGVGVSIGVRNEKVTVLEVLEGYSAQKQGVKVGDVIVKINDTDIDPEKMDEISPLVKGDPGTDVQLKVLRTGEPDTLTFNLLREEVIVRTLVFADFYPENSGNVYLKLSNFSRSASDEIRNALKKLKEKREITSIILDLRSNPGGLLDVAVDVCDKFLKKDLLIVSTRGRDLKSEKKYYAREEPLAGNEKLVVLINGGSASASEIVAGAIQDHDRGIILGTQSFGKGLVQTITPLSFNTSLKVTTARYYTPSGRCIQRIDYSKNNNVIPYPDSLKSDSYSTDNKRIVYSAGGITPDTTIQDENKSDLVEDLLAKGLVFNFADKYYYENKSIPFDKIKDEKLLSEFKKFIDSPDYKYQSLAEKKLDEVVKSLDENHSTQKVNETIKQLKEQIESLFDSEFESSKQNITAELKAELALRYSGIEFGIKELLKYDNQFNVAIKLINDNKVYSSMLKNRM
ncbi:MAG: S41 family peptidase [Ignavibacteriaceae bacterium]